MQRNKFIVSLLTMTILFLGHSQNMENVKIVTTKLTDQVFMLEGRGGNIGVSVGNDGIFVIDDQFAPLTPKILTAIRKLGNQPIRFVVNTHWHGDHTGGNENMAKEGATVMAHDNVRKRLEETPTRSGDMRSKEALPVITFNDQMSVHMNGEKVEVFHVDHAHTDGDALLYFTESNVLHTGDTYFKERYPFIDLNSGGSVYGAIKAVKETLKKINDETKIIPGHGSISNKVEYAGYLAMLEAIKVGVETEIANNKTEDEVANNSEITAIYDAKGFGDYYINRETILRTFYRSLKK